MSDQPNICCISCNKIIAQGRMQEGRIEIKCRHCGTMNKIEAAKPEPKQLSNEERIALRNSYIEKGLIK